jgi:histidine triad (HIT) family protein
VTTPCAFCGIAAGRELASIVFEDAERLAFLDHRPLFPGHVLVVPRPHYETLADLPPERIAGLFGLARELTRAVGPALGAEGSFVALNNTVSQAVPHLHVHVVPRRRKDGLRGFFWPRTRYRSDAHRDEVRDALRRALRALHPAG